MPSWPPPLFYSTWTYDERNGLILLKLPDHIKLGRTCDKTLPPPPLSSLDKPDHPPRAAPTFPTLPLDIIYEVIHQLPPVDRTCLALTCRSMCATVLSSPRVTPDIWASFIPSADSTAQWWNSMAPPLSFAPELYELRQRLAHGWVNKRQWRYCWGCHKILPRDKSWWLDGCDRYGKKRFIGRKSPRWNPKTGVPRNEWTGWSKRRRNQWLLDVWSKAEWDDSSVIGCNTCREELVTRDVERLDLELSGAKEALVRNGHREFQVANFVGTRHPVECPGCLERDLTYRWRRSKRSVAKKVFWSFVDYFGECVGAVLYCVVNVTVVAVMVVCECVVAAGETVYGCLPRGVSRGLSRVGNHIMRGMRRVTALVR